MVKIITVKSSSNRTHTKPVRAGNGRLKTTEPTVRGRTSDIKDASQVLIPSVGQSRREKLTAMVVKPKWMPRTHPSVWVPVIGSTGKPLMPCRPAYAKALIKSGRAQKRWFRGIFAIKLLDRAEGNVQQVVCGVDPGSKREALTVQSKQHTYQNVLFDAVTWVKDRVEVRRNMRRSRRFRKTPCRKNKSNRGVGKRLPPSTRSRWQIKLNMIKFLQKLYPIKDIVVEDIMARTWKGAKKWNKSFSPLEVGKAWFYDEVSLMGNLIKKQGYDTYEKRNHLGLKKSTKKLAETFDAHCVDSWVLASFVTGKSVVDNMSMYRVIPMQLHRRQLHRYEPGVGGVRKPYGGTGSMGLRRGSVVDHTKLGMVYVGGTMNGAVSLHDVKSGKRLTQAGSVKDCNFLHYNSWRTEWLGELPPTTKVVGFRKNS